MRNPVIVILLLPIIIFLWMMGWTLFWLGSRNSPRKTLNQTGKDTIHVLTMIPEEHKAHSPP